MAVGGGKGGVGKSLVSTNLAVALARTGAKVVMLDADLGAPNLHTMFGIMRPQRTVEDFLAGRSATLDEVALATPIPGLRLIGTAREKASVLSFVMEGIHPHDIGTLLDRQGIAVRTGHHCAQPVMDFFNVPATTRASLAFYNTFGEIDALVAGLHKVKEVFA